MSTYLLAFVVSDFENELCPPTGNGVQFRIWARKNALDQGGNSLALCLFKPEMSLKYVQVLVMLEKLPIKFDSKATSS